MLQIYTWFRDQVHPGDSCNNGFPLSVVQIVIANKISNFNKIKHASMQKYSVYLYLSWLCGISKRFVKLLLQTVQRCYFSSNVRLIFHAKPTLTSIRKDVLLLIIIIIIFTCLGLVSVRAASWKNYPKAGC